MPDDRFDVTPLASTVEIGAAAKRVWAILTDFPAYPQWNPFIVSIEGRLRSGAVLTLRLALPDKPVMTFKPRLKIVSSPRELRWVSQVLAPGLFEGEHGFRIEPLASDRCRLRYLEDFSGVFVPMLVPGLQQASRAGFGAMNQALKERAERG